jgi:hypothetical protein
MLKKSRQKIMANQDWEILHLQFLETSEKDQILQES